MTLGPRMRPITDEERRAFIMNEHRSQPAPASSAKGEIRGFIADGLAWWAFRLNVWALRVDPHRRGPRH